MNRNNVTCTHTRYSFSTMSGTGINGYIISVSIYREKQRKHQYGQLNGMIVTSWEEAAKLALEYGYIRQYGRNICKFVQSRAARKRGYTPSKENWCYWSKVEYHRKRLGKQ